MSENGKKSDVEFHPDFDEKLVEAFNKRDYKPKEVNECYEVVKQLNLPVFGRDPGRLTLAVMSQLKNSKHCDLEGLKKLLQIPNLPKDAILGLWGMPDYDLFAVGNDGFLFVNRKRKYVVKYSTNVEQEKEFLDKIMKLSGCKNIIQPVSHVFTNEGGVKMNYIAGDSLENIISNRRLGVWKTIRYAYDLISGLNEMRDAGIYYHRDLRPANVMIDEETDRAVIIDLGIATTDKHYMQRIYKICQETGVFPTKNRRFGGPNDLVSLGQIMYLMATGEHLFFNPETGEGSESISRTFSSVADMINDYRTKVYLDESGELLDRHLKQVDENVKDSDLAFLIKECLTAKNYDYGLMKRVFERYRE